ncbi:MAG: MFS transporter [Chloroflexota bacterium]
MRLLLSDVEATMQATALSLNTVRLHATLITVDRTVINTGFRMVYPLLPVLARGAGVELSAIAGILTFTQLIGVAAPVMGELAERRSKRFNLVMGMALSAFGFSLVFILPGGIGLGAALLIAAFGKTTLFDPAAQAYVGDRVPYEQRGAIMALMELSWSMAFLLGVPAMAWLIDAFDWRAPFAVLGLLSFAGALAALALLETDDATTKSGQPLLRNIRTALSTRAARAGLVLGFGISAANQLINIVFGTWIEVTFGVALAALAAASAVIGASELLGEGAVAGLADRFGKRRMVAIGIGINILACIALPATGVSLVVALATLFVFYLGFEVSLVATIPLASELAPTTRGMYMTLLVAGFTLGRALVTYPSTLLYEAAGLWANCAVAIVMNVVALIAVLAFIDPEPAKA